MISAGIWLGFLGVVFVILGVAAYCIERYEERINKRD